VTNSATIPPASPRLASAEITQRFAALQTKLAPQWRLIRSLNHEPHTVVVVPSMSLDVEVPAAILQAYEERMLFLLLLLRQARTRLIYVTSQPILPEVIDYYLALLPGIIPSQARRRLFTVPVLDGSTRPLSEKLLERPRLLARLRELIPDPDTAHLVPFITTEAEQELAVRLGIPMYAADPRFFDFGTKSGGRRLFAEEGVPHPAGREGLALARRGGRGDPLDPRRTPRRCRGDRQAQRRGVRARQRARRPARHGAGGRCR
jgi:hypothetical protein